MHRIAPLPSFTLIMSRQLLVETNSSVSCTSMVQGHWKLLNNIELQLNIYCSDLWQIPRDVLNSRRSKVLDKYSDCGHRQQSGEVTKEHLFKREFKQNVCQNNDFQQTGILYVFIVFLKNCKGITNKITLWKANFSRPLNPCLSLLTETDTCTVSGKVNTCTNGAFALDSWILSLSKRIQ